MATEFVDWLIKPEGGQRVIDNFAVNGHILYSAAPKGDDATIL
jgi:ABC-type tungstate transport system permease subunit